MTESSVRVGVRVRPLVAREKGSGTTITAADSNSLKFKGQTFTFDHVFDSDLSQTSLYQQTAAPMLRNYLDGYNCTIMAYGQTGSGKTYTMGTNDNTIINNGEEGLIPRFVTDLYENLMNSSSNSNNNSLKNHHHDDDDIMRITNPFSPSKETESSTSSSSSVINHEDEMEINSSDHIEEERHYKMKVSFLEIYGEDVYDLLNVPSSNGRHYLDISNRTSLPVREDETGRVFVQGQTEIEVTNATATLDLLTMGSNNRLTASTAMNSGSSRSHAVFTLYLEQSIRKLGSEDDYHIMNSKLTFVDLAGSERIKRTGAEGQRMKEGIQINSGLFNLGQVINSLADEQRLRNGNKANFIPYRNSKLTHLLKDALGGNSQTLFLACVSPADSNDNETLSTLNYAKQARNIQNKPVKNMDKMQIEMRRLKYGLKAWMMKALQLQFGEISSNISEKSLYDDNILSPIQSRQISNNKRAEEEFLRRPDVIAFIQSVNNSIDLRMDISGPSSRKVRLSESFSLPDLNDGQPLFGSTSPVKSGGFFNGKRLIQPSDHYDLDGYTQPPPSRRRDSVLASATISHAITAAARLDLEEGPEALVERLVDMTNTEKRILGELVAGHDGVDGETSVDNEDIQKMDRLIAEKEAILSKLSDSTRSYEVIRIEFERLLDSINSLETEKNELESQLETMKREAVSVQHSERIRDRFNIVKTELTRMKEDRKMKEQAYLVAQRESRRCEVLQTELKKLKEAKVQLVKQHKQHVAEMQRFRREHTQTIHAAKRSDRKHQQQFSALKTELLKKERILGVRDKELGAIRSKLKACETHITSLLRSQHSKLRGTNQFGGSTLSRSTGNSTERLFIKPSSQEKSRDGMNAEEYKHFSSSRSLLEELLSAEVQRNTTGKCREMHTIELSRLSDEVIQFSQTLESLSKKRLEILSMFGVQNTEIDSNTFSTSQLSAEAQHDLQVLQSQIQWTETHVERLSRRIDICGAELEALGDENDVTSSGQDSSASWEAVGKGVIAGLSVTQSHALIADYLADRCSLAESTQLLEYSLATTRANLLDAQRSVRELRAELDKSTQMTHELLADAEKQRVNDVWAILQANTASISTEGNTSQNTDSKAISDAKETAQAVLVHRSQSLERELELAKQREDSLREALQTQKSAEQALESKLESLNHRLQMQNSLLNEDEAGNAGGGGVAFSASYLAELSDLWDRCGCSADERRQVMDSLLQAKKNAQTQALQSAMASLADFQQRVDLSSSHLTQLCKALQVDIATFLPSSTTLDTILTSWPRKLAYETLCKSLHQAYLVAAEPYNRLVNQKTQLVTLVDRMWLSNQDLHPSLHPLYQLEMRFYEDSLITDTEEMIPSEHMERIYIISENLLSLNASFNDLDIWQSELTRLQMKRVETTQKTEEERRNARLLLDGLALSHTDLSTILAPFRTQPLTASGNLGHALVSSVVYEEAIRALTTNVSGSSLRCGSEKLRSCLESMRIYLETLSANRAILGKIGCKVLSELHRIFQDPPLLTPEQLSLLDECTNLTIFSNRQLQNLLECCFQVSTDIRLLRGQYGNELLVALQTLSGGNTNVSTGLDSGNMNAFLNQIDTFLRSRMDAFFASAVTSPPQNVGAASFAVGGSMTSYWELIVVMEDAVNEFTDVIDVIEENWITTILRRLTSEWSISHKSPDSFRHALVESFILRNEVRRLDNIVTQYQDLRRLDTALTAHVTELEAFETSAKHDRAKVLSGNSRQLIEEERFRRAGKKKFEHFSDRMLAAHAKLQQLTTFSNSNSSTTGGSPAGQNSSGVSAGIEVRLDFHGLSIQGQALLRGGLGKERLELIRLNAATAGSANVAALVRDEPPKPPRSANSRSSVARATPMTSGSSGSRIGLSPMRSPRGAASPMRPPPSPST